MAAVAPVIVQNSPTDASCLKFSPVSNNHFVTGSWSKEVRLYEYNERCESLGRAVISHAAPVLGLAWSPDGTQVFSASCDATVKMWNLEHNKEAKVAQHAAPIRHVRYSPEINALVTGSWDKTVAYWDVRTPGAAAKASVALGERVYAMDVKGRLMVVGTSDCKVYMFDMRHPTKPFQVDRSPLKHQTRCLSVFPDVSGYALASIEGRVAIQYVDPARVARNFTFKCHRVDRATSRDTERVYPVNALTFHPRLGTFATAGSDGGCAFWCKDAKKRLKLFPRVANSVVDCDFSADGSMLGCAVSYDWSMGMDHHNKKNPSHISLCSRVQDHMRPSK